jgi:hypothetical protein
MNMNIAVNWIPFQLSMLPHFTDENETSPKQKTQEESLSLIDN